MKKKGIAKAALTTLLFVLGVSLSQAATPPALVNYQGVLRDASDTPLSGTYDMIFRFYDADPGGNLLLTDSHLASGAKAVSVSGGLFSVVLGDGAVAAGTEPTLSEVFRNHASVYLEVTVGAETLSPRVRVTSSGYALNADHLDGMSSAEFIDTSATSQTKIGTLRVDGSVQGFGQIYGGYFKDLGNSGEARVGYGDVGIQASGSSLAADFVGNVGVSGNVGIGTAATTSYKLDVAGPVRFINPAFEQFSFVAAGYAGMRVSATGFVSEAGRFTCGPVADDCYGLIVEGRSLGAEISSDRGYARIAPLGGYGIHANGDNAGGFFESGASWAKAGFPSYKIQGTGSVSFVQNHPTKSDKVIVYAAPEGDEVAVYTRGTARLVGGEARVRLGPTFRWVTNPDIGLTAHLTPRDDCNGLYVASMSTDELVVRELNGGKSDVVFDYLVYGLRIGFEEASIVQEKTIESFIPSMKNHRELYARRPELRSFSALERYRAVQVEAGLPAADFSGADALRAAIHEYDPATDPPACELLGLGPCPDERLTRHRGLESQTTAQAQSVGKPSPEMEGTAAGSTVPSAAVFAGRHPSDVAAPARPASPGTVFPVSEAVEAGDLLVLDPVHAGQFRKASAPGEASVIGIAADASQLDAEGNMNVVPVDGFYTRVKADAVYGAIWPGDLLVSSATLGHAMKAPDVVVPGTVIGKALESLESGTGLIKVLVTPR